MPARAAEAHADLVLVRTALAGDEAARQRLVERIETLPAAIRARHRRYGAPLTRDQLEDVLQNVLLALWQKLATFDGRVPLPAWAVGFGTFELRKAIGRARGRREHAGDVPDLPDPRAGHDSEPALAALLARLAPEDQAILASRHVEERSFAEIAAEIGSPIASVKSRYYRAIESIRRRLPPREDPA